MGSTGTAKRTVGGLSEEEALKNILDSIREYYEKYAHLHSTRFSDSLDVSNPKNWDFKEPTKSNLKGKSGIYIIYEKGKGRPIYVGSSTNLYNRITMLLSEDSNGHMNHTLTTKLIRDELASDLESACKFYHSKCSFKFLPTKNISEAVMLEGVFKELLKPEYNYEIMRSYPDFS